jgi:hypothetical protein
MHSGIPQFYGKRADGAKTDRSQRSVNGELLTQSQPELTTNIPLYAFYEDFMKIRLFI